MPNVVDPALILGVPVAVILIAVAIAEHFGRLPALLGIMGLAAAAGAVSLWGATCSLIPGIGSSLDSVPPDPCVSFYAAPMKLAVFAAIMLALAAVRAMDAHPRIDPAD